MIVMLFISCENQRELPNPYPTEGTEQYLSENQLLIQSVQQHFDSEIKDQSFEKSGLTSRQSLDKYPLWNRAYVRNNDKVGRIVIVPLFFPETLYVQESGDS
jgi:hypothetical protein